MTIDGIKAGKRDFDAMQAERKKRRCADAESGVTRAGSTNPALEEWGGFFADMFSAFASQGAAFYATLGTSVVTGSAGMTPCTFLGGIIGFVHADGTATRTVEGWMNNVVDWLGRTRDETADEVLDESVIPSCLHWHDFFPAGTNCWRALCNCWQALWAA